MASIVDQKRQPVIDRFRFLSRVYVYFTDQMKNTGKNRHLIDLEVFLANYRYCIDKFKGLKQSHYRCVIQRPRQKFVCKIHTSNLTTLNLCILFSYVIKNSCSKLHVVCEVQLRHVNRNKRYYLFRFYEDILVIQV